MLANLFALAAAHLACGQTEIRITGSTAFRAAVHQAIGDALTSGYTVGFTGTTLASATEAIFKGTTRTGGINVIVKTAWSGSVGGVFSLTSGNGLPDATAGPPITAGFLVDPTPTSPPPGTANVPAKFETPVGPAALDKPGFPNIAMSDSFQASTSFKTPVLADTQVGVVPFVWVRNNGSPATITNMTSQLAAAILLNGSLPQYHFDNSGSTTPAENRRIRLEHTELDPG